jgi:S-adenosyl-L-methionine hydrolase (adenosine-forming)
MRRIALVTDFGTRDPYVAAVKGVIAARTNAPVLDLTHDIEPLDVFQAAWFLRAIVRYWPPDTIFMVVVDPGVGTARRILALESDGRTYLAPDNGALTFIEGRVWSVENESLFLPGSSTTFHGRDRFAPVAAALANGFSINELGRRITDPIRLKYTPPCYSADRVSGTIVAIDRFGNAISDIEAARLPFSTFEVRVGDTKITRQSKTYSGAEPFTIVGSTECIEVSMAGESAATLLHLRRGDPLMVVPA